MEEQIIGFKDKYNLTPLDFDAVMEHLRRMGKQEKIDVNNGSEMSKILIMFFMQNYFNGLSITEIESSITDGPDDQGIDAIYIEENGDENNIVYIIQSKLCMQRDKFLDTSFSSNEVDKLLNKFDTIIVNQKFRDQANPRLRDKLDEIKRTDNKVYRIILLTTAANPPVKAAYERIEEELGDYNKNKDFVSIEFVGIGALVSLLPSLKDIKIDFKIQLEGDVIDCPSGNTRVLVGRTQASDIAEVVKKEGQRLFDRNIRIYLKKSNPVNRKILETASSEKMSQYFFILNNGITVVCDEFVYMGNQRSPLISVKGGQIVNGGQTSNSLFECYVNNKLSKNTEVLVRIIQTKDTDIVGMVTEATNSQTSVRSPDLHSNDQVQKKIQSYIISKYDLYYETKKNEFQGKVPSKKRIDKETAAQAYYSYAMGEPVKAKANKSKLFSEYYDTIFNDRLLKENEVDKFLLAYEILTSLKELNKDDQINTKVPWCKDALLTSLALCKDFSHIKNIESLRKDQERKWKVLKKDYMSILKSTGRIIKDEIKKVGEAKFEKRRFFIAASSFGRIYEDMLDNSKEG